LTVLIFEITVDMLYVYCIDIPAAFINGYSNKNRWTEFH